MKRRLLPLLAAFALLLGAAVMPGARAAAQENDPPRISLADFKALLASGAPVTVLDVRGPSPTKIKGAIHIPLADLESRLSEIPRDRPIVTYCA